MKSNQPTSMTPVGFWRQARTATERAENGAVPLSERMPAGTNVNFTLVSSQSMTGRSTDPAFQSLRLRDLQSDIQQDVVRTHLIRTIGRGEADKLERAIEDFKKHAVDDPKALLPQAEIILQYLILRDELAYFVEQGDLDNLLEACLRVEAPEMRLYKELLTAELMQARKSITVLKRKAMLPVTLTFDDGTMRELRRYHKPPKIMSDVITATFLLLGECEEYTANWNVAREMLNPFGKSTGFLPSNRRIKDRFDDFDALKVHPDIGARVRQILQPYTLSNAFEVSECCASFFVWCKTALEIMAKNIENAKPASPAKQKEILGMHGNFPSSRTAPWNGAGRIYQKPRGLRVDSADGNSTGRLPTLNMKKSSAASSGTRTTRQ